MSAQWWYRWTRVIQDVCYEARYVLAPLIVGMWIVIIVSVIW